MNPTDTAQVVALLSAAFPQWSPSKETVALYHRSLLDLDATDVFTACEQWILTEERPPTIAAFRQKVAEVTGSLVISANEAWAEVQAIAYKYGYEGEGRPRWSSPLIGKAVSVVGWWEVCCGSNPTATRAQFLKAFGEMKTRADNDVVLSVGFRGEERLALTSSSGVALERSAGRLGINQGAGK